MTRRTAQAGFTLIEVMVSVSIVAIISALLWSSMSDTTKIKRKFEAIQDRTAQVRMALDRMAREIAMAYISDHEDPTISDRRTLFDGHGRGSIDALTFSYMGHERLFKDAPEADTAVVMYYGEPDPNDRRKTNLMRRETRRLQAIDPRKLPGDAYVLCEDVVRLKITYYDRQKKEWHDEWSTVNADGQQYLPWRVRIQLVVRDERGVEVPYVTEAHTMLTERIGWTPQ
jgi:general secretion pathway protein J